MCVGVCGWQVGRTARHSRPAPEHTGSGWDAKITAYNMQLKHETSLCHHTLALAHTRATASTSDSLTCFVQMYLCTKYHIQTALVWRMECTQLPFHSPGSSRKCATVHVVHSRVCCSPARSYNVSVHNPIQYRAIWRFDMHAPIQTTHSSCSRQANLRISELVRDFDTHSAAS